MNEEKIRTESNRNTRRDFLRNLNVDGNVNRTGSHKLGHGYVD